MLIEYDDKRRSLSGLVAIINRLDDIGYRNC